MLIRSLICFAVVLTTVSAAQAGIELDNFSDNTGATNAAVNRSVSGISEFTGGLLYIDVSGSATTGSVSYTMASGTFDNLGNVSGGFTVGIANVLGGANLEVKYDGTTVYDAGFADGLFELTNDLTGVSAIEFIFSPLAGVVGGSGAVLGGGNGALTAVPEPTSLILVGIAVAGLAVPRRRVAVA